MSTVYDIINQRIIELLEKGTVPWRKPWNAEINMPKNLVSKREYQGVNVFLLSSMPYGSPYWLTFNQAKEKGGHIRKGEKSTPVIFWKMLDKVTTYASEEESKNGKMPLLRYYSVFNVEQCEGINIPVSEEVVNQFSPIERAEEIISKMPLRPDIQYGGNKAYYRPSSDTITLPPKHTFESPEEFYNTYFHELSHATGHETRLARKSVMETIVYGSNEYSKEELVAEMGAAFLCGHCGIEQQTLENSAAYIQGWLKALKDDRKLLVHAASQAQKSADYILNRKGDNEQLNNEQAA